jgi:flagellar protein FlbD
MTLSDRSVAAVNVPAGTADIASEKDRPMIRLTRLNHAPVILNADLIEHIEVTPDTVITLTTGQILRVRESADEVVRRIVQFRRRISAPGADPGELCQELPEDSESISEPDRSGE